MKSLYHILYAIVAFLCIATSDSRAQTAYTVTTVPPLNAGNSSNGVSFNIKAYQAVTIKEIWVSHTGTGSKTMNVWYRSDSMFATTSGATNVSTTNGWIKLVNGQTFTATTSGAGVLEKLPFTIDVNIPAGGTYGFVVECTNSSINYSNTGTTLPVNQQYLFGDGTIYINTGMNVGWGGLAPTLVNHPRQFNGKIVYVLSCATPTGLTVSNVQKTSASFNWNAVTTTSTGYEYALTTSATPPASGTPITATSYNALGLSAGTTYYFHVRNRCSPTSTGGWATVTFTTPICTAIDTIKVGNVTDVAAFVNWNTISIADHYEYILTQNSATPVSSVGATTTPGTTAQFNGLLPNTNYFFFVRSRCFAAADSSDWSSTSFATRAECLPPQPVVNNGNPNEPVVSWSDMPFATGYEYAVTKSPAPPALGKTIYNTQIAVPLPSDNGDGYYFHVRTKCYDIFTTSAWATIELRTPTGIEDVNGAYAYIKAYPNPVKNHLQIELNTAPGGTVTITNIAGQVIYTTDVTARRLDIQLDKVPAGIYLIKYRNGDNSQTLKFVKE